MKRIITAVLALLLALTASSALVSCSKKGEFDPPTGWQAASDEKADFYFYVPDSWTVDYSTAAAGAYFSAADPSSVSVMACPGGCVNGGGQPTQPAEVRHKVDLKKVRAAVLYDADAKKLEYRKSHENPLIKKIYEEFLGEPNSHKAHELLHTHYVKRGL